MRVLLWLLVAINGGDPDAGKEPTDWLVPSGWQGNPWGPAANAARKAGEIPAIPDTPQMKQWDQWGRKVLKNGDILFRRGDAKILGGWFPFSRFIANISGSPYSHIGTVVIEDGEPVVYDTTKASVRRQPLKIWILDNKGPFGVKRLKPEFQNRIPKVVEYLHSVYQKQVPFDYELSSDDRELYCVEMAEKENINQFPLCVLGFTNLTSLKLDQAVFFPGNERHGIWSSSLLETVYQSSPASASTKTPSTAAPSVPPTPPIVKDQKPAAPQQKSVAGRPSGTPRN